MSPLRRYRDSEDITLEELGRRLGVTKSTAWKLERRERIDADLAVEIEQKIGVPRTELRPDLWPAPAQAAE